MTFTSILRVRFSGFAFVYHPHVPQTVGRVLDRKPRQFLGKCHVGTQLREQLCKADIERLYMLRRNLLRLRNAVVPLVDVCRRHEHLDLPGMDASLHNLFRDVTDHVRRVQEDIDSLREVLAFTFEASLMIGQSEQTVIARKLASWAAILAVPTAIAGIYGMNFHDMPELSFRYGYFVVLAVIFVICTTLFRLFRQARRL